MSVSKRHMTGTDSICSEIKRLADEFWAENSEEDYVVTGRPRRTMRRRGRRNIVPASARSGLGQAWLKKFRAYQGDECILYPFRTAASPRGVLQYNFRKMTATRAMCLMAHKLPPAGKDLALHICGNGHLGCVNPNHLYWGNAKENALDAAEHKKNGKPSASGPVAGEGFQIVSMASTL